MTNKYSLFYSLKSVSLTRKRFILLTITMLLGYLFNPLMLQGQHINNISSTRGSIPGKYIFFKGDTLSGFDFQGLYAKLKNDNADAVEMSNYIYLKEKAFVFFKYHPKTKSVPGTSQVYVINKDGDHLVAANNPGHYIKGQRILMAPHTTASAGCDNLDFSDGNFTNWSGAYGFNGYGLTGSATFKYYPNWLQPLVNNPNPPVFGVNTPMNGFCSWLTLMFTGTDPCGGFPVVCPGYSYSCRIGGSSVNLCPAIGGCGSTSTTPDAPGTTDDYYDTAAGNFVGQGEMLEQSFPITAANCLLTINYAVVLNDGGHKAGQQPFVGFNVLDQNGNSIQCLQYYQELTAGVAPPGYMKGNKINPSTTYGGDTSTCYYLPWNKVALNMQSYIGQTVTFQAFACGCFLGGHFAYAYIDAGCGPLTVTVSPSCGSSTITAPPGAMSYSWTGPCITSGATSQTVTVGCSGTYTCNINLTSNTACSYTIDTTITVNPVPAITVNPAAPNLCLGSGSGDTLNTTGAGTGGTYTWTPATGLNTTNGATVIATPTSNITYTVTGTSTYGCKNTQTVTVTVSPSPTVTVSPPTAGICPGGNISLTANGASTYTWAPNTALSASTGATVTATPTTSITYTVTGSNAAGCTNTASATITVKQIQVSANAGSQKLCSGDTTTLTATGAVNYVWSNGATSSVISVTPGTTTTYTVTGTSGPGCTDMASVTVQVNPSPTVTVASTSDSICAGDSTTLTASGANSYTWTPSSGLNTTTGATVIAYPAATTTYTITGISSAACNGSGSVTVKVNPLPTILAWPANSTICSGASTSLTASGGTTYVWSPSTGLSSTTGSPVTAAPDSTVIYTVTGSNASGCTDTASVLLTVNPSPTLSISVSGNDTVCNGQPVTLTVTGNGNTYTWNTGSTNQTIVVIPTASPSTYSVITFNGVCTDSASQKVFLFPPLVLNMPMHDSICDGQQVSLLATTNGGKIPYIYTWVPSIGTGPGPYLITPGSSPATYSCMVTDGCNNKDTAYTEVITKPSPTVSFTGAPNPVQGGGYVTFASTTTSTSSWFWNFGNGSTSTDSLPYTQYDAAGDYIVTLWVTSANGCKDSANDTIYVTQDIIIPNVFTPNGDGQNDVFHVTVASAKEYNIDIYNRWGQRVFTSDSPEIDWTGRSQSGVQESDGTYYYIIKFTDYTGKKYTYTGPVELLRGHGQ